MFRTLATAAAGLALALATQAATAERNYWAEPAAYGSEGNERWDSDDTYYPAAHQDSAYGLTDDGDGYGSETINDYGRVIEVQPIYRYVTVQTPRRECWDEVVYRDEYRDHRRGTAPAAIAGGIIGGVVGHQFGSGRGNDAMTVLGTLVGSAIARDVAAGQRARRASGYSEPRSVERCRTHSEAHRERRVDGYKVTYRYEGRTYVTRTREHPGERVAVQVTVTPYEG